MSVWYTLTKVPGVSGVNETKNYLPDNAGELKTLFTQLSQKLAQHQLQVLYGYFAQSIDDLNEIPGRQYVDTCGWDQVNHIGCGLVFILGPVTQ